MVKDDEDLIYEGIATWPVISFFTTPRIPDDEDLIYEGIATAGSFGVVLDSAISTTKT